MNCVCVGSRTQDRFQTFPTDDVDCLVKQVCDEFLGANVVDDSVWGLRVEVHKDVDVDVDVAVGAPFTAGYRPEQCRVNDPERSQVGLTLLQCCNDLFRGH